MISVEIYKTNAGFIKRFFITGHAGYAQEGSDIVCAAVSMLAQTIALALQHLLKVPITLKLDKGNMDCALPVDYIGQHDVQLLLEAMELGLRNIEQGYKEYIKVFEKGE